MAYTELGLYYDQQCLNDFTNQEPEWMQYVTDHYQYLRDTASVHQIQPTDMNTYKYRLGDYLIDKGFDKHTEWIIMLINQINSPMEFINREQMLIPSNKILSEMRGQFDTYMANKN